MLKSALYRTGHGYDVSQRGPCTAFDGLTIIANPLGAWTPADRQSRIFKGGDHYGVDYGSHAVYLLTETDKPGRNYFIAVHNGGGRQVWQLPACFHHLAETVNALVAMPERALYSLLYGITEALDETRRAAMIETHAEWQRAAVQKRIRRRAYPSRGKATAWIEPERKPDESDSSFNLRKALAAPRKR